MLARIFRGMCSIAFWILFLVLDIQSDKNEKEERQITIWAPSWAVIGPGASCMTFTHYMTDLTWNKLCLDSIKDINTDYSINVYGNRMIVEYND